MEERDARDSHLRELLNVLRKRQWTVIAFLVMMVTTVAVSVFKMTPVYRATARLQIDRENPNILSFKEVMELDTSRDDYYQTQYKLLQSRSLSLEVTKKLDLARHPDFIEPENEGRGKEKAKAVLNAILSWFGASLAPVGNAAGPSAASSPALREDAAANLLAERFLQRVEVAPLRNTRLVDVSVSSRYPDLATRMANTLAELFIERNMGLLQGATREATNWLSTQLEESLKKVEESENALQRYKEKHGIVAIEDKQNIVMQRLNELNSALTQAKTDRIAKEMRFQQMMKVAGSPDLMDALPEVINNDLIQQLRKEYVNLQNELSEISKDYTPKHPKIIGLKSKMESMENKLRDEVKKVAIGIRSEFEVARAKEASLKETLEAQKKEAQALSQRSINLGILNREVENNRRIYTILLNRAKETSISEGLNTGNIRVVDRAVTPLKPIKPRKGLSLALAVVVGLLGGVGLALFFDYLDDSIKDPDDLERYLKLPYLASIPGVKNIRGEKTAIECFVEREPHSFHAEAFRSARTSILLSSLESPPRSIIITSAGPMEGKTTVAGNLALTMAHAGAKVLLMDADLRKPRLHKIFRLDNQFGLSNLLTVSTDTPRALCGVGIDNLYVMGSGPTSPNPSELLGSTRMKKLLATLQAGFEFIIIDSAPLISVTDAVLLSPEVDGVVLVIHTEKTSWRIINRAKKQLEDVHARILGVVLNFVNVRKSGYYNYPKYYYSYYGKGRAGTKQQPVKNA